MKPVKVKKAYLPTIDEARGVSLDDIEALRWIPERHRKTFAQPISVSRSQKEGHGNTIPYELEVARQEHGLPLPGLLDESKTGINPRRDVAGTWVGPSNLGTLLEPDFTFDPKKESGILLGTTESPHWWRTMAQGANSKGGEGFQYGGFPKESFVEIPRPYNASPIEIAGGAYNTVTGLSEPSPEMADFLNQFPSEQGTHRWGQAMGSPLTEQQLIDQELITPLSLEQRIVDSPFLPRKVASEPMDIAMRLLKRDRIYDPDAENKGQEGIDWHPGEEGIDWDSAVSSSLHPSHDLTQRHPFDYDMHEYDHYAQKLLNLMRNRDVAYLQDNENPMTEDEQFDLMDARQKLQASIPKNTHFPSIQNAVGYDKDGNKTSTFGDGRPKFNEGSPRYQELIGDRPTVPIYTEGSFYGVPFNEETGFTRSEPMDIALQLLKERVSPEAKRHKLEYDKKYESSPERVKYREELNRERRRRGIYGSHDHKDISHTEGGKLTLEGEHENRARHFKDKGTLRQVNKAQQTLPSYDEKIVQSLTKPDQSTMYISSRPGRETVSAEEQSAKHDELLAAIAELNKNREMNILTGTGKGEWGNENSIAIQNYPLEIKQQLYELARRYGQDAVAESNAREKGIRFVNPASGEDTFSFGGREIQENPRYSTDFPTGQKISFTE